MQHHLRHVNRANVCRFVERLRVLAAQSRQYIVEAGAVQDTLTLVGLPKPGNLGPSGRRPPCSRSDTREAGSARCPMKTQAPAAAAAQATGTAQAAMAANRGFPLIRYVFHAMVSPWSGGCRDGGARESFRPILPSGPSLERTHLARRNRANSRRSTCLRSRVARLAVLLTRNLGSTCLMIAVAEQRRPNRTYTYRRVGSSDDAHAQPAVTLSAQLPVVPFRLAFTRGDSLFFSAAKSGRSEASFQRSWNCPHRRSKSSVGCPVRV